ncbi:MAG: hypothetical protein KF910_10105 [Brevundimonas sp.]|nr:hypothetical protein [Brevundimonas sp.]
MSPAMLILWLTVQTPYAAATPSDVYAPPPVRPFEPSEAFALSAPMSGPRLEPLTEPETLDRFRLGYRTGPEPLDAAYNQAVAAAEAQADAMAGPLDGSWLVMQDGRALGRLVLSDWTSGALDGAFGDGVAPATPLSGRREGGRAELALPGGALTLRHVRDGWTGRWKGETVTLKREP